MVHENPMIEEQLLALEWLAPKRVQLLRHLLTIPPRLPKLSPPPSNFQLVCVKCGSVDLKVDYSCVASDRHAFDLACGKCGCKEVKPRN